MTNRTIPDLPDGYRIVALGQGERDPSMWSCYISKIDDPRGPVQMSIGHNPEEAVRNTINVLGVETNG